MAAWQIILLAVGVALILFGSSLGRAIKVWVRSRVRKPGTDRTIDRELQYGAKPAWLKITKIDVIYGFCMVVGILAKELWDSLNEFQRVTVRPSRIIAALIVSPVIYAGVYSSFVQNQVSLLGMAIAFQNGFFWQAVFRTAQGNTNGTGEQLT